MTNKTKTTLGLIIFLVLLIAIYLIWQNPLDHQITSDVQEKIITTDLANLQKIEIIKKDKTITLVKTNDQWLVESDANAVANTSLIDKLLTDLKATKIGTIISSNPEKYKDFSLTEEAATKLKLTSDQGQVIAELLLGKTTGPSYQQMYLKKADSQNILLIDQLLAADINAQDWKQPPPPPATTNTNQPDAPTNTNQPVK
jgi:hypothetical protein